MTTTTTTTATTTEPPARGAKIPPRIGLSALEWRLYLVTGLAAIYTAAWLAMAAAVPPPMAAAGAEEPAAAAAPATVWIDQLPPAAQPVVVLPAGWMRASPATPVVRAAAPVVRATPTRRVRVRTRSS